MEGNAIQGRPLAVEFSTMLSGSIGVTYLYDAMIFVCSFFFLNVTFKNDNAAGLDVYLRLRTL